MQTSPPAQAVDPNQVTGLVALSGLMTSKRFQEDALFDLRYEETGTRPVT
jgi:hypothetical protein